VPAALPLCFSVVLPGSQHPILPTAARHVLDFSHVSAPRVPGSRAHRLLSNHSAAASADGCTHVLVLATRPAMQHTTLQRYMRGTVVWAVKKTVLNAPYMSEAWASDLAEEGEGSRQGGARTERGRGSPAPGQASPGGVKGRGSAGG